MLWNAGVALDSAIDLCRQSPLILPPETRAQLCHLTARHLDLMVRCHVHPVPKCHAFLHFAHASDFLGNPWFYTTFEDESQNRTARYDRSWCTQSAVVSKGCCCRGAKNLVIVRVAVSANRDGGD